MSSLRASGRRTDAWLALLFGALLAGSGLLAQGSGEELEAELERSKLEDLGRALFFDVNLSLSRTQACGTCHDPARGFIDWRDNGVAGAASLGGDGLSLGDRNAPSAGYAALIPPFGRDADGEWTGGQFWDGRAADLEEQAGGPPFNPVEMGMPDEHAVALRLLESPIYEQAFAGLFGAQVLDDAQNAYAAMTKAIAAFERSAFFSPFDSKYDRYLRGEYQPTQEEELGMTLFFSEQFTNCRQCHQLNARALTEGETFSNYRFHNLGVPVNQALRAANGLGPEHIDHGLLENPAVRGDAAQDGKFKVPSLRNVAITGPYMHNGVFQDLRTVIAFYNKYNSRAAKAQINPETGEPWGEPEVPGTVDLELLELGPALDERRIDALVAFLKMLTDRRYEFLLEAAPGGRSPQSAAAAALPAAD